MLKDQQEILDKYQGVIEELTLELAVCKRKIDQFSLFRVGLLVVDVLAFILFVSSSTQLGQILGAVGLVIPVVVFILVVRIQERAKKEEAGLKNLRWVYQNELNVINQANNGYSNGSQFEDETHPYLSDLDIFGKYSLFNLVNRSVTQRGIENLADAFSKPLNSQTILQRQEAIKEIATHIESTYYFRANLKDDKAEKLAEIKEKLSGQLGNQLQFVQSSALRFYVKLLPFITPILMLGGLIFGDRVWGIFTLMLFFNAIVSFLLLKKANLIYSGFTGSANALNNYALAIKWIEDKNWQSIYIKKLVQSEEKISVHIKELGGIIQAFDARLNILIGAFLNFTLLWDIRCSIKLDVWYKKYALNINKGLDSIGDFEELISLATFQYNSPTASYPTIVNEYSLEAKEISHPLIPLSKSVANNFNFAGLPTVNIITGSNMAGKSTFLRTLGINMVLAYAGAAVYAEQLQLSIFSINTYMRIKDSINESTSTFKAELNRLKMILSNVKVQQNPLVLIDEMLRGTNSHDKYLGSKVFIEKMIAENAPTLFATHDLHLAEMEKEQPKKVANYHFDIQITQGEMNFDYKLKEGPCKVFNAAILLKEIGLSLN